MFVNNHKYVPTATLEITFYSQIFFIKIYDLPTYFVLGESKFN